MQNVQKTGGITLDDLGRMVAEGFHGVGKELKEIRGEMGGMNDRLNGMNDQLDGANVRLKSVETKLDKALYTEYVSLESRVTRLEDTVGIGK